MFTRYRYILFILYLFLVGYIVFFNGPRSILTAESRDVHIELIPFHNTGFTLAQLMDKSFADQYVLLYNLIGNILLFVPFSFLLLYKSTRYTPLFVMSMAFLFSCSIECVQYFFVCGITDVDDVILNTFGACLGVVISRQLSGKYTM
ncbi:VanZ family protein [Cytophaga aurantiaca]|uniref:VanZ family protein n=1 Tax=Cytophaga aurantiaca TaxID=29530 RepID=UPI00037FD903|nr:VanZ family protein [Cytophaga aurantiaca]